MRRDAAYYARRILGFTAIFVITFTAAIAFGFAIALIITAITTPLIAWLIVRSELGDGQF